MYILNLTFESISNAMKDLWVIDLPTSRRTLLLKHLTLSNEYTREEMEEKVQGIVNLVLEATNNTPKAFCVLISGEPHFTPLLEKALVAITKVGYIQYKNDQNSPDRKFNNFYWVN